MTISKSRDGGPLAMNGPFLAISRIQAAGTEMTGGSSVRFWSCLSGHYRAIAKLC